MKIIQSNLLIVVFLLLFQAGFGQSLSSKKPKTTAKDYYERIDFEFVNNKIIIPIEINGKVYRFLVDTGAPNMISRELYDLLQPQFLKEISISDSNNKKQNIDLVLVKELKIGTLLFENIESLVYDFNENPVLKCFGFDGFIGSNMLRNSIIQLDADKKEMILTDNVNRLTLNNKASTKIKLIGDQGSPYIWINLKGKDDGKEQLLIDTGMGGLYSLSARNYKQFQKEEIFEVIAKGKGSSSVGIFADVEPIERLKLLVPTFKLGNTRFKNVVTTTSTDNNSKIGAGFLAHGIMTIDFINKKFYFEGKSNDIQIEEPVFGFTPTLSQNKLVIGVVWEDELKDYLQFGDEILEMNGTEFNESNFCSYWTNKSFFPDMDTVKIKVKSATGEVTEVIAHKKLASKSI
ncbi:retropepsin-like aspartic protease [Sphingobacterium hungaricum]|uniref:Aspartyl protease n=1 Tax=Sphingobacterium hungaricum TaxID=2082723 RepID=A0A928UZE7_9SPHI|nr:retropepsin-like aspartic protease [Sphingobacterium hungaricum]MBE8714888.1 hypothetical protein [Sphingobacterium hungaricum]